MVAMRGRFAVLIVAALVIACARQTPAEESGSSTPPLPSPTTVATSATPPTTTPTAQTTERPFGAGDVVATTVKNLRVRQGPGTESGVIGFLELGSPAFILAQPTDVDGIPWYPASGLGLPLATGCEQIPPDQPISCPAWLGWIAGANTNGDTWLERTTVSDCPAADVEGIIGSGYTYRLICFGNRKLSFTAYWPELPPDAGLGGACREQGTALGWLLCQNINYNVVTADKPAADDFLYGLRLSINPASNVAMPDRGQWLRITGHFDDPAAQRCHEVLGRYSPGPLAAVFMCRLEFVATAIAPTTGP